MTTDKIDPVISGDSHQLSKKENVDPETEKMLDDMIYWIVNSYVGENCVYWTGYLPLDCQGRSLYAGKVRRVANLFWSSGITPDSPDKENVGNWGKGLGLVALTQRRLGDFSYEYIATKVVEVPRELRAVYAQTLKQ